MKKAKKIVLLGLWTSLALMIHIIEKQIPVLFPGIKLGLSNMVSFSVLILMGWKEALGVMALRIVLGAAFGGGISSFLFSITGGLLSNLVMIFLYRYFKGHLSLSYISVSGAIFHNIGQLLVASLIIQNAKIYVYLPILLVSAVVTGYFVGLSTFYLCKYMKKISSCCAKL